MPNTISDDSLAAARLGQGWAFEGIYRDLGGPVHRFLAAQGVVDPEALTQDVFLRAFRNLERFSGDGEALRSWIFTIAHNLLIDDRRAATRRPRPDCADDLAGVAELGSQDALDAVLERGRIRFLLDALPSEQRRVVALRFLADLPLADVAIVMDRSLEAVKALQHRGLAQLRRLLEELPEEAASSMPIPTFTTL